MFNSILTAVFESKLCFTNSKPLLIFMVINLELKKPSEYLTCSQKIFSALVCIGDTTIRLENSSIVDKKKHYPFLSLFFTGPQKSNTNNSRDLFSYFLLMNLNETCFCSFN